MAKRDKTEDLVKELIHEEDWKRMNATAELLKRGPEAVRHLLTGLTDENSRVRAEAALMLGRIKDRTAGVPIIKLLTDAEPLVRTAAAEALQHVRIRPRAGWRPRPWSSWRTHGALTPGSKLWAIPRSASLPRGR